MSKHKSTEPIQSSVGATSSKKIRSYFKRSGMVALSIGLLAYLFEKGWITTASLRAAGNPLVLFACFALTGAIIYTTALRWRVLVLSQGVLINRFESLKLTLIGQFFNIFVPGGLGGDFVKGYLVSRTRQERKLQLAFTVVSDRVFGLFSMALIALIGLLVRPSITFQSTSLQIIFWVVLSLAVGIPVGTAVVLSNRFDRLITPLLSRFRPLKALWDVLSQSRLSAKELFKMFLYSLASQLFTIAVFIIIAHAIEVSPPPFSIFSFVVPIGFMVTAIPIFPGGIGIGQAAFLYLFSAVLQRPTEIGAVAITVYQGFFILYSIAGSALLGFESDLKNELNKATENSLI